MATSKLELPQIPEVPKGIEGQDRELYEYLRSLKENIELMKGVTQGGMDFPLVNIQGRQAIKDITNNYNITPQDFGKTLRCLGSLDMTLTLPAVDGKYDGYRISIIKGHTGTLTIIPTSNYYIGGAELAARGVANTKTDQHEYITLEYCHPLRRYFIVSETGWKQYGCIYASDAAADQTLAAASTWYQVTKFAVNGVSNGVTPDHTEDHLIVSSPGVYKASYSISAHGHLSHDYELHIETNNGATTHAESGVHFSTPTAARVESTHAAALMELSRGDTVELWIQRTTAGSDIVITFDHLSLSIHRIH